MVATIPDKKYPPPMVIPMAAFTNTNAADVNPSMRCFDCKMVPAPIKPMPDTTCAAIRVGSPVVASNEKWVNKHEPKQIKLCVLIPAGFPMVSRSIPTTIPHPIDKVILMMKNNQFNSVPKKLHGGIIADIQFYRPLGLPFFIIHR